MESHIRVYIRANWDALKYLSCGTYKVLMCLVQRADSLGRCFPSVERIAEDVDLHVRTVYAALETLAECRYIGYLRQNECDPVTGRVLPNVYLVSPHLLCIAEDNQLEALALWKSVYEGMPLPMPFESKVHTNQQQEPDSKNQHQGTSTRNQQQQPPFPEKSENDETTESPGEKPKNRKPQKRRDDNDAANQQAVGSQRSEKTGSSAKITERYNNPDPIPAPLLDTLSEALANDVNKLLIPIPMARGFVVGYGYDAVNAAYQQTLIADRDGVIRTTQAGFFRAILQRGYTDANLPDAVKSKNPFANMSWSDFADESENL